MWIRKKRLAKLENALSEIQSMELDGRQERSVLRDQLRMLNKDTEHRISVFENSHCKLERHFELLLRHLNLYLSLSDEEIKKVPRVPLNPTVRLPENEEGETENVDK